MRAWFVLLLLIPSGLGLTLSLSEPSNDIVAGGPDATIDATVSIDCMEELLANPGIQQAITVEFSAIANATAMAFIGPSSIVLPCESPFDTPSETRTFQVAAGGSTEALVPHEVILTATSEADERTAKTTVNVLPVFVLSVRAESRAVEQAGEPVVFEISLENLGNAAATIATMVVDKGDSITVDPVPEFMVDIGQIHEFEVTAAMSGGGQESFTLQFIPKAANGDEGAPIGLNLVIRNREGVIQETPFLPLAFIVGLLAIASRRQP